MLDMNHWVNWALNINTNKQNPARDRLQLMTMGLHCTELFIFTSSAFRYDLNNVERDVKHKIIIIVIFCGEIRKIFNWLLSYLEPHV